ncbi:hypothetical protein KAR91_36880 [Candidatus Pacearchaeota archaeon]|nr:hypothetical protein [Candidatus Pacearchaeota archaeon]
MANFEPSALALAQAKLFGAFQAGTMKFRFPETFLRILASSKDFYLNYQAQRTREDRTLTAYYKKRTSRAISAARSHDHTGTQGDSGTLTPSWAVTASNFSSHLKLADNNIYSLDELVMSEFENVMRDQVEDHESVAANFLFNNRSGVNASDGIEGDFDGVNDIFEVASTKEKRIGQIIQSMMEVNKWSGTGLLIFCDTRMFNKVNFYAQQGQANSENLAFQFMGNTWIHSIDMNSLAIGLGYTEGFCISVQDGMIGCLPHIPKQNVMGVQTTVNLYGTIINPIDGLSYAFHEYEARADGSASGGYTQDVKTERQVSIDLAFDDAPLDTAGETVIQATAIVEAVV